MSDKTIAIVGAGGLGTPAAWSMVEHWPKDTRLTLRIVDGDTVQLSNLNRQIFFTEADVGKPKARSLCTGLAALRSDVEFDPRETHLSAASIEELLADCDYVLECTDSIATKFLLNDWCVSRRIPFCYAGTIGMKGLLLEVAGNGPCLRCLFGDLSEDDIQLQNATCQSGGIVGPVAGMFGLLQAQHAVDYLTGKNIGPAKLLRFDGEKLTFQETVVSADEDCPIECAGAAPTLNLCAKVCPETFLYTKLALESLKREKSLQVVFQTEAIAASVKRSCLEEGYHVSEPARRGETWMLTIERGE